MLYHALEARARGLGLADAVHAEGRRGAAPPARPGPEARLGAGGARGACCRAAALAGTPAPIFPRIDRKTMQEALKNAEETRRPRRSATPRPPPPPPPRWARTRHGRSPRQHHHHRRLRQGGAARGGGALRGAGPEGGQAAAPPRQPRRRGADRAGRAWRSTTSRRRWSGAR